ncbi:MAG: sugar phosphate isomerase/epimerase [Spirochaetales bacterium]|jgi:sugar phosphate isomerase/epimerase|nr:sugar phosphate isomerase/epimerase [Spirochaetales bacterium]
MFQYALCASPGAALHEPVLFREDFDKLFPKAKELGFGGVEIHLRDAADADADMLEKLSRASGVKVAAIATGLAKRIDGLTLIDTDEAGRRRAIQRLKGHIDLAARFGCPVIIGSMRGNLPSGDAASEAYRLLAASIRELADYTGSKNCSIAFEAINRYENNYLNTAAETAAFLKEVNSEKVGMMLDAFHMNMEETDMHAALWEHRDKLLHVHLADNTRLFPGSGSLDFKALLRTLRQCGYGGWLSMEYLPLPDEETAALWGIEYMKGIEKMG